MARKKIVAGNWKMNMTPSQAVKLVEELKPLVVSDDVEVVYCVPAIDIVPVVEAVKVRDSRPRRLAAGNGIPHTGREAATECRSWGAAARRRESDGRRRAPS